jgi:drug/metabolite transporter (DMT)-like permease
MSRRTLWLFLLLGFLWGVPYLFIKVAVDPDSGLSPAMVVFGRVFIGALILIPLALREKTLGIAMRGIKYVALYALMEMIGPWILIGTAEQSISSGLAGLLVASVPIWSTLITWYYGDKTVLQPRRLAGMLIGFFGVFLLVGIESVTGASNPLAIFMVLVASFFYAFAVIAVSRNLPGVSGVAVNAVAMAITAVVYLPFVFITWPDHQIAGRSFGAVAALGILSTGIAFGIFFSILHEMGPTRVSLVTYLNTACAVVLGVIILSEPLTPGIIVGLPLVLFGSFLASRKTPVAI